MSSITVINASDLITNSRAVINDNFSALNADKIETSVLDTDTTLAANSDSKVATQKAVKAYVDAGGNVNASETTKGISEEATDAETLAGTSTGGTGAKLFVTPAKLATALPSLLTALPTLITDVSTATTAVTRNAGSTGVTTTNIYTKSLTAGYFTANNGFKIRVNCSTTVASGNVQAISRVLVKLGGTTLATADIGVATNGSNPDFTGNTFVDLFVLNNASTSSQILVLSYGTISTTAVSTYYYPFKHQALGTTSTSSVATSGTVSLDVDFQIETYDAFSSGSVTGKSVIVEKISK